MSYLITTGSNRIYDLDTSISKKIDDTCYLFCKYEYSAYQTIFKYKNKNDSFRKDFNKSFQNYFKHKFGIDDYYANSLVNDAKGIYTSQEKCLKLYKEKLETDIKNINNKIAKENKTLNKYINLRNNIHLYRKDNSIKIKTGMGHISFKKNIFIIRNLKTQEKKEYNINKFEYEYLNKKLKEFGISIYDEISCTDRRDRSVGIREYIQDKQIENYVILDDVIYGDYKEYDLLEHLVNTKRLEGLTKEKVDECIKILSM